jgi:hypothetical protein
MVAWDATVKAVKVVRTAVSTDAERSRGIRQQKKGRAIPEGFNLFDSVAS